MAEKILKIALFIEGTFYLRLNTYYKFHHERKSTINFSGLTDFITDEVSKLEGVDKRMCKVVDKHWFRGRYSTIQLEKKFADDEYRLQFMTNERRVDDVFMYENVSIHSYPLMVDSVSGEAEERGINIWLTLTAYEITMLKGFDVVVLLAGDSNYVPLMRKLNSLGVRTMVLGWDFQYETSGTNGKVYKVTTRTSQVLLDSCTYPVMIDQRIDDRSSRNNPVVNALFNSWNS